MPDFARYDATEWVWVDDVASVCPRILSDRSRPRAERVHQVWPDLGRLAPRAEIVQIGPALAGRAVPAVATAVTRMTRRGRCAPPWNDQGVDDEAFPYGRGAG